MNLNDYQTAALRTARFDQDETTQLATLGLGIAGEAGEVADELKKVIGHGHELDREKLCKEIGDVLWYASVLAHKLGFTLEEVAKANVEKLLARYPDGFSAERSREREEARPECVPDGCRWTWATDGLGRRVPIWESQSEADEIDVFNPDSPRVPWQWYGEWGQEWGIPTRPENPLTESLHLECLAFREKLDAEDAAK